MKRNEMELKWLKGSWQLPLIGLLLTGCDSVLTDQYEATALTTLTWQVNYTDGVNSGKRGRFEEFSSASLLNRNGEKPEGRVTGPDDQELWWPIIPPKPSLDEIEQRQKSAETAGKPELLRTVKYEMTYQKDGQTVTQPTNYQVYRQVVKAYPDNRPLRLTLGINDASVEKAEPLN